MGKKLLTIFCAHCGKKVSCYEFNKKVFCSTQCYQEFRKLNHVTCKEVFTCFQCGKSFTSYVYQPRIFCSMSCYATFRRDYPGDWRKPGSKKVTHEKICLACGLGFTTKRKHAKYCSRACFLGTDKWKTASCRKGTKWSCLYDSCKRCGRSDVPHHGRGLCQQCRSRIKRRKERGTYNKACAVCGETRSTNRSHIVPKCKGGTDAKWNILFLCATHHSCFDCNELSDKEFLSIADKVHTAFKRSKLDCFKGPIKENYPHFLSAEDRKTYINTGR